MEKTLEVVAARIWEGDRFLITRRPAHKARALQWEFPGGKVEEGESREAALIRECREELAVEIAVKGAAASVEHTYPDLTIRLTLFDAAICGGTLQKLEHEALCWVTAETCGEYDLCPADRALLEQMKG